MMRCAKRNTPIDAPCAPEFLDVEPGNEPAKAVTDQVNAATADVSAEVLTQSKRALLYPGAGIVVEGKDLFDATQMKVRRQRIQSGTIREIAMYQNDGPLIPLARRAAARRFDPEREESSYRGDAESLLRDQLPDRSFRCAIVLDHLVPLRSSKDVYRAV